jgi:4-diphosphocytidyl-2-C-methyl-D-erythritol kinase
LPSETKSTVENNLQVLVVFPNAKINIGLRIGGKRPDGYHNLQTVFYPIALRDALEILPHHGGERDIFTQTGILPDVAEENNLVIKAVRLLRGAGYQIPPLQIHLHKTIPMGAGLGGGSADAAFTLTLLNRLFHLNITEEQLAAYALQLGSDCPFFIFNHPAAATGRGEQLKPLSIPLKNYKIVLVLPGLHISTAKAFKALKQYSSDHPANYMHLPVEEWKQCVVNDFEELAITVHPELKTIKEALYAAGAVYAAMTGTGSSFYGIFPALPPTLPELPGHYSIITL